MGVVKAVMKILLCAIGGHCMHRSGGFVIYVLHDDRCCVCVCVCATLLHASWGLPIFSPCSGLMSTHLLGHRTHCRGA